jgi:hypothetical protein
MNKFSTFFVDRQLKPIQTKRDKVEGVFEMRVIAQYVTIITPDFLLFVGFTVVYMRDKT